MKPNQKERIKVLFVVLGVASIFLGVGYRHKNTDVADLVVGIVHDRSTSSRDGCDSVVALTQQAEREAWEEKLDLKLLLFATGDRNSAQEPLQFTPAQLVYDSRVIDGNTDAVNAQRRLLLQVREWCNHLETSESSPILISLQRAVAQVRALQVQGHSRSRVLAQTDLEETNDPTLSAAVHQHEHNSIPALIDNSGLYVEFCGYAETYGEYAGKNGKTRVLTPTRSATAVSNLQASWVAEFQMPELVKFKPFCPKSDDRVPAEISGF
jgi:hypothetical protein